MYMGQLSAAWITKTPSATTRPSSASSAPAQNSGHCTNSPSDFAFAARTEARGSTRGSAQERVERVGERAPLLSFDMYGVRREREARCESDSERESERESDGGVCPRDVFREIKNILLNERNSQAP